MKERMQTRLALDQVVVVDAGGRGVARVARRDVDARRPAPRHLLLQRDDGVLGIRARLRVAGLR